MFIISFFKALQRKQQLKAAIKKAESLRVHTYKKQLVIYHNKKFSIVAKQDLKALHAQGSFKKGVPFRDILKAVTYSTK
jgi:hypothetical protein